MSGTSGQSLRLEGIHIKIVAKDVVDPVDPPVVDPVDPPVVDPPVTPPVDPPGTDPWAPVIIDNPNYVSWVVNLPQTEHKHVWVDQMEIDKVDGVIVYRMSKINTNDVKHYDIEKYYRADVANGCKYNFVEWVQGYGNTLYPQGFVKAGKTGGLSYSDFIAGMPRAVLFDDKIGRTQASMTNEEREWADTHMHTTYCYCAICGKTTLGGTDW